MFKQLPRPKLPFWASSPSGSTILGTASLKNTATSHPFSCTTIRAAAQNPHKNDNAKAIKTIINFANKRKPFQAFVFITLGALLFISIKDFQQTSIYNQNDLDLVRPTSWPLYLYSYLPLNTISRLWGSFNNITLPKGLREPTFKFYSYLFNVKLDEMLDPNLENYKNLGDFFYREIKPSCRPIDYNALLVSPSDGKVLKFGNVNADGTIDQVKGFSYNLKALLGDSTSQKVAHSQSIDFNHQDKDHDEVYQLEQEFLSHLENNTHKVSTPQPQSAQRSLITFSHEGERSILHPTTREILNATTALTPSGEETDLFYTVIYLAPGDYHRFHSPVTWVSTIRRHFVGELYSVAPYFQNTLNNLFVLNERVALLGYWKHGFFSMTPVGATNVGSIKLNFDKDLVTNTRHQNGKKSKKNTCYEAHYNNASPTLKGQPLFKGEEVGGFRLGSTVVLVFEAPKNFKFNLQEGQIVKMGQKIGDVENS
ncbi:phosphatidylserine decarboxylase [Pichia kudriavzevii]|uniref:Phosphatidylserine decarboxylase proenzyme 1, mitochondrial n=1 Tax=Pichia kudriavzevii TaxID=4909 RepID=A0A1Z8JUJ2_PICKU|nr:uncharacterized protein C5L36_0C06380 [Pichia kudriavzevii]AWU76715.1 hypothetical protein C5L36_0C06380 [Pichia kudriavzevii]OUT24268.1 phosphatidylserine decarboxylase [Pichia kudriavzevii]